MNFHAQCWNIWHCGDADEAGEEGVATGGS
jgi:hypothetical protein